MGFIIIVAINSVVVIIWMKIIKRLDTYAEYKNRKAVYVGFFFLGIASVIPTMFFYFITDPFYYALNTPNHRLDAFLNNFLFVGPIEETSKFLVFFLVAKKAKTIREPQDGILQAASVALGFAFVENIRYALWYGPDVLVYRSVINIGGHMLYASVWGAIAGLYLIELHAAKQIKTKYNLGVLLIAMAFVHGAWNFLITSDYSILAYCVNIFVLLLFLSIYKDFKELSPFKQYPIREYRKAIKDLNGWLRRTPENYILHKRIAHYYIYAGEYSKAEKHLQFYGKKAPNDYVAAYYLGVVSILQGDVSRGKQMVQKVENKLPHKKRKLIYHSVKKTLPSKYERENVAAVLK